MTRARPAVFLDRDGTLIKDWHFIGEPEQVELLEGAAGAVRRLNEAGWPVIIVTNQSGIARGYFTESDYHNVRERLNALLADGGARVDASYMCPHHPDFSGPCECRKPGTLLFRRAVQEHALDPKRSWYIGDKLRDVRPAGELGGNGVMIPNDETPPDDVALARKEFAVATSLDEAVAQVIKSRK